MTETVGFTLKVTDDGSTVVDRLSAFFGELDKSAEKAKSSLNDFNKTSDNSTVAAGSSSKALIGVSVAIAAVTAAIGVAITSMKSFIAMANEQEAAEEKIAAVLEATGHASGFTAKELSRMSSAMQNVTTYADEVILNMMAVIATFDQIRGENFERVSKLALDMSDIFDRDLKAAALAVGRALQDPVKGMQGLTRAGAMLTEEQQNLVKGLAESGRFLEAQNTLLDILEAKYSGAAAAATKTFGGSIQQLYNDLNDLGEQLGSLVTKSDGTVDSIQELRGYVKELTEYVNENKGAMQSWIGEAIVGIIKELKETAGIVSNTIGVFTDLSGAVKDFAASFNIKVDTQGTLGFLLMTKGPGGLAEWLGITKGAKQEILDMTDVLRNYTRALADEMAIKAGKKPLTAEGAPYQTFPIDNEEYKRTLAAKEAAKTKPRPTYVDEEAIKKAQREAEKLAKLLREIDVLYEDAVASASNAWFEYAHTTGAVFESLQLVDDEGITHMLTGITKMAPEASKDLRGVEDALKGIYSEQAAIAQLEKEVEEGIKKSVEGYEKKYAQIEASVSSWSLRISGTFGDTLYAAMQGNFDDIGDMWKNMLDNMVADLFASMLQGYIQQYFKDLGAKMALSMNEGFSSSSGGESGGWIASIIGLISKIWGGGSGFSGAPYATGGIIAEPVIGVGTRSGKSYSIGEEGPETVTRGITGSEGGGGGGVSITNIVDKRLVAQYLQSPEGQRSVLNIIGSNTGTVKRMIAR